MLPFCEEFLELEGPAFDGKLIAARAPRAPGAAGGLRRPCAGVASGGRRRGSGGGALADVRGTMKPGRCVSIAAVHGGAFAAIDHR